ncbi:kelch repeat and BTB domain-containing protein 3-like [Physella acuta]|uniref:kelch repeat and BTB domain-containing protein 3-like n=1 Tax=Physella acuta TaxID=109671 RepID=UPI0027DDE870|nr:kelch repeat and BTB domain-containing protein 3-like [Physella acuta]
MNIQEVCVQIVQILENVWSEKTLFDFAVKVQDETIQCHRLILAACSEFFKALFRSGMKEVTENCVVLKDVSCEVFRLIISTMYTGTSLLTLDNFIEVWQAAHMLQVKVMVNVCEEFAIRSCSLDTWENIYLHAKLLGSVKVLDKLHTFMLKNFEEIRHSTTFFQLSFKETHDLIKSQDLVVSKEDLVLESVIRWVEYVDGNQLNQNSNEDHTISGNNVKTNISLSSDEAKEIKESEDGLHRNNCLQNSNKSKGRAMHEVHTAYSIGPVKSSRKDKFRELLMQVRTCLVSHAAFYRVLKLRLFSEMEHSRELILDAMSYHVQEFRHGQWSSAAIHRSCSEYTNAGIYAYGSNGIFEIITESMASE